jgi:hypothetical protein
VSGSPQPVGHARRRAVGRSKSAALLDTGAALRDQPACAGGRGGVRRRRCSGTGYRMQPGLHAGIQPRPHLTGLTQGSKSVVVPDGPRRIANATFTGQTSCTGDVNQYCSVLPIGGTSRGTEPRWSGTGLVICRRPPSATSCHAVGRPERTHAAIRAAQNLRHSGRNDATTNRPCWLTEPVCSFGDTLPLIGN